MDEKLIIKKFIIRKLYRHRTWMHKHTSIHNLQKGLPNNLRTKEVRKAIDELLKEQILLSKPTHYGLEVSLNPKKLEEIELLIKD